MAKSLRSKWRRKCRAVKRVRYGAKELERLKKTLGITETGETNVDMTEISEVVTVTPKEVIRTRSAAKKAREETEEEIEKKEEPMEADGTRRVFNPKTFRDQNGSYPVWLHQRKQKAAKKPKKKLQKKRSG